MKILIVEDDEDQAQDLEQTLRREFRGVQCRRVELEEDFQNEFEEIASEHFDLAIVDMMLEWADPSPNMSPPPGPYDEAGLRCRNKLKQDSRTATIPVIMLSVLRRDMPPEVDYVVKTPELRELVEMVRKIAKPGAATTRSR